MDFFLVIFNRIYFQSDESCLDSRSRIIWQLVLPTSFVMTFFGIKKHMDWKKEQSKDEGKFGAGS
jgi:hypothetical protein